MRLAYELTMEDLLAFHRYYYATSPGVRRAIFISRAVLVTMIVGFCVMMDLHQGTWMFSLVAALFVVIFFMFIGKAQRTQLDKQARKLVQEGSLHNVLGPMEIELTDTHLVHRAAMTESQLRYEGIERVVHADDYLFIFLAASSAHIVPRRAVSGDQFTAFIEALRRHIDKPVESASLPSSDHAPPPIPIDAHPRPMRTLIAQYLHDREATCPACGYNLRGAQGSSCPECGQTLELSLQSQGGEPGQAIWVFAIISQAALGSLLFTHAMWPLMRGMVDGMAHAMAVAFALASPLLLWVALRSRRRFIRMEKKLQLNIALIIILFHLIAVLGMLDAALR